MGEKNCGSVITVMVILQGIREGEDLAAEWLGLARISGLSVLDSWLEWRQDRL